MSASHPLPQFILDRDLPSAIRWTFDKLRFSEKLMNLEGRFVENRTWSFEGKFSRRPDAYFRQWDRPQEGRQYLVTLRVTGGHYRGQKPVVSVCIEEYASKDGKPLPR